MSKILLTGSSGFVGSNILESFSKTNICYLIVRKSPGKKIRQNKNIRIIKFNNYTSLNNKLKNIKVNTVIHGATHYVKNHKHKDIEKLINSNILLGNIILENLKNMKVKKFINFSTVWEDSNAIANNPENLYAAYKKGFGSILNFYKKILPSVSFIELMLTDTFGKNDTRDKIINTLKKNYLKNKITKIISKNLYLNILNIDDVINAVKIVFENNIKSNKFVLKNSIHFKILDLINNFNRKNKVKIKIKWLSNKLIKNKIYNYNKLRYWKANKSKINNIIDIIKN